MSQEENSQGSKGAVELVAAGNGGDADSSKNFSSPFSRRDLSHDSMREFEKGKKTAKVVPSDGGDQDLDEYNPTGKRQRECYYCGWNSFRYYYRHPFPRIFVATFIAVLNFLIYAEDPIAHSRVEGEIPIIGTDLSLIFSRYPDEGGLYALKLFTVIGFILLGMFIGRQLVHHKLLRDKLKMNMFTESKGTWMIMFFV